MHLPKAPASCEHLDLARVERVLTKHYGDIPAAARELNIPTPDLRRLTWSKPKLLEEAELEREGVIARAWGQLIQALYSDDPRRQMWASDKIMASYLARDHSVSSSAAGDVGESGGEFCTITFRWADGDLATDKLERDGQTFAVPSYGGEAARPLASLAAPTPLPPESPRWLGPHAPPEAPRRPSKRGYR
jgi:hypothetical protein